MKNKTVWIAGFICLSVVFGAAAIAIGYSDIIRDDDAVSAGAQEKDSKPLIVVDPGHGGEDGGCSSASGQLEKDLNLIISGDIADMLNACGYPAVLTREEDSLLYDLYGELSDYKGHKKVYDLKNRLRFAEESGAVVLISIHMNKFSDSDCRGLQVYYSANDSGSVKLADLIQSDTAKYLQPDNNRMTKRAGSSIYLLDRIKIPAVMVECGFLSNPDEAEKLSDADYQKRLALCISCSLMEYLANAAEG